MISNIRKYAYMVTSVFSDYFRRNGIVSLEWVQFVVLNVNWNMGGLAQKKLFLVSSFRRHNVHLTNRKELDVENSFYKLQNSTLKLSARINTLIQIAKITITTERNQYFSLIKSLHCYNTWFRSFCLKLGGYSEWLKIWNKKSISCCNQRHYCLTKNIKSEIKFK